MAVTTWTSAEAVNNPIAWVKLNSTDPDSSAMYVKCPSAYSVEIDDISNPDAGRTANGQMVKSMLRVGGYPVRAKALSMEWAYISSADIGGILQVFQYAEYLYVKYFDPRENDYKMDWFYVGNRTMPMYNKAMNIWTSLSLKLITQNRS